MSTSKEIAITALYAHPVGEHVVVAGEERETHLLMAAIYTVNGDFERKIQPNETLNRTFFGTQSPALTVSQQGHITVAFDVKWGGRVIVLKNYRTSRGDN